MTVAPTPYVAPKASHIVLPGQDPSGQYILSVLVKRTYDIVDGTACRRAGKDQKIHTADVPYGDPLNSSIKFESDFVPFKLATDIVVNAKCYAPGGRAVTHLMASVRVGNVQKDVVVIGDRVCRYQAGQLPWFSDPQPFTEIQMVYERAYGGTDIYSDPKVPCSYIRNPMGTGFAVENKHKSIDGLSLPNLEDPTNLLRPDNFCCGHFMHWERQPMPAGFGWWAKNWAPRCRLAGVLPADRATERELRQAFAQVLPPDQKKQYLENELPSMNFRFFNGASPGLTLPFLKGVETIECQNLTQEGRLSFDLPGEQPILGLDIGEGIQQPEVVLQTVMVQLEERKVDLVWRGAVQYPGPDWLPQMRKMEVQIA